MPAINLTPEMRQRIDSRHSLDAYYFGFDSTGDEDIDRILAAVALAGKAYHSTEWWADEEDEGYSLVDLIQAAANHAAGVKNGSPSAGGES